MKNGYNKIDKALRKYSMKTSGALGTVWSSGWAIDNYLTSKGYKVEDNIVNPTYDYIVIGKSKSTLENVLKALTRLNSGGILICIVDHKWAVIQERNNR